MQKQATAVSDILNTKTNKSSIPIGGPHRGLCIVLNGKKVEKNYL